MKHEITCSNEALTLLDEQARRLSSLIYDSAEAHARQRGVDNIEPIDVMHINHAIDQFTSLLESVRQAAFPIQPIFTKQDTL